MKRNLRSAAFYRRKAAVCRELGRWAGADEWKRLAAKAAKRERTAKHPVNPSTVKE